MLRQTGRLTAAMIVPLLICGCRATFSQQSWANEYVSGSSAGGSASLNRYGGVTITANDICVYPRKGKKICDVKVTVSSDPDKPGKVVKTIPGEFKGWKSKSVTVSVADRTDKAYVVIEGKPCDNKKKTVVVASIPIGPEGIVPFTGLPKSGPSMAICGSSEMPHFIEFSQLSNGRYRFTIGDLAAAKSPLRRIYERRHKLQPTLLGALVLVNGQLVHWVVGSGVHSVDLPPFRGKLKNVVVLTVDRQLRLAQTLRLGELRL